MDWFKPRSKKSKSSASIWGMNSNTNIKQKRPQSKISKASNTFSLIKSVKNHPFNLSIRKPNKVIKKSNMNWDQAKQRYPKLRAYDDTDKDGVLNIFDCRPLNKKKQGFQHQYSFSSTGSKKIQTVKMSPELFLKTTYGEGQRNISKLKHRDIKENRIPKYPYQGDNESYEEYKQHLDNNDYTAKMAKAIKSKGNTKHLPVPFLEFNEAGQQVGHEGRHTALAAMKAGLAVMPVTIERPKETRLTTKYELLEPIKGKQYQDWKTGKPPIITEKQLGPNGIDGSIEPSLQSLEPKRYTNESEFNKLRRLRNEAYGLREINAAEFKKKWEEQEHTSPERESIDLAWNKDRLSRALERNEDDAYPMVSYGEDGRVYIGDGRHRISAAAMRGQNIDVAVAPLEDMEPGPAYESVPDDAPPVETYEPSEEVEVAEPSEEVEVAEPSEEEMAQEFVDNEEEKQ